MGHGCFTSPGVSQGSFPGVVVGRVLSVDLQHLSVSNSIFISILSHGDPGYGTLFFFKFSIIDLQCCISDAQQSDSVTYIYILLDSFYGIFCWVF